MIITIATLVSVASAAIALACVGYNVYAKKPMLAVSLENNTIKRKRVKNVVLTLKNRGSREARRIIVVLQCLTADALYNNEDAWETQATFVFDEGDNLLPGEDCDMIVDLPDYFKGIDRAGIKIKLHHMDDLVNLNVAKLFRHKSLYRRYERKVVLLCRTKEGEQCTQLSRMAVTVENYERVHFSATPPV